MTICEAVRELRKHRGESQQVFATRLKMSISALQNYERDRVPELEKLFYLLADAHGAGRDDLVLVFKNEMADISGAFDAFPQLDDRFDRLVLSKAWDFIREPQYREQGEALLALVLSVLRDDRIEEFQETAAERGFKLPPRKRFPARGRKQRLRENSRKLEQAEKQFARDQKKALNRTPEEELEKQRVLGKAFEAARAERAKGESPK